MIYFLDLCVDISTTVRPKLLLMTNRKLHNYALSIDIKVDELG